MKITYFLTFIIFMTMCHAKSSNDTKTDNHSVDTILINNKLKFHVKLKDIGSDYAILMVSLDQNLILSDTIEGLSAIAYFKFPDFDLDGNSDLLFDYIGNNSTYVLYLFDSSSNTFKEIKDYYQFPDAIHLKSNPNYYYSYHRAGCADMNWESDLFQIIDFKITHLANIYGQGCDFDTEQNPQVLEIYKIQADNKTKELKERLQYKDCIPEFDDKWNFIEKYWNSNYQEFLP